MIAFDINSPLFLLFAVILDYFVRVRYYLTDYIPLVKTYSLKEPPLATDKMGYDDT